MQLYVDFTLTHVARSPLDFHSEKLELDKHELFNFVCSHSSRQLKLSHTILFIEFLKLNRANLCSTFSNKFQLDCTASLRTSDYI